MKTKERSMALLTKEIEGLRAAYAGLNRNDLSGFMAIFDPDIRRVEPSGFPMSGTYIGLDAVKAHFLKARETWAEGACEPEEFIAIDQQQVIALVHVRVRLKHEETWREGHIADVFVFRQGKAIAFRTFVNKDDAVKWVAENGLNSASHRLLDR
jgi:ketosteroid isomerase-like protein